MYFGDYQNNSLPSREITDKSFSITYMCIKCNLSKSQKVITINRKKNKHNLSKSQKVITIN